MFRDFIETILIKEDFDDPKERARRAAQKRREKEEAAKKLMAASKLVSFNFILINLFNSALQFHPLEISWKNH